MQELENAGTENEVTEDNEHDNEEAKVITTLRRYLWC